MAKPRHFLAVFGELERGKEGVESGVYCPNPKHPPSAMSMAIGDMLLLYCTANYHDYQIEAPGLGIVLKLAPDRIDYRWLPFAQPIPRETIKTGLDSGAAARFGQLHFGHNWLIEIFPEAFSKIVGERTVAFQKL